MSSEPDDNSTGTGSNGTTPQCRDKNKCSASTCAASSRNAVKSNTEIKCPIMAKMASNLNEERTNQSNHTKEMTPHSVDGLNMQVRIQNGDGNFNTNKPSSPAERNECVSCSKCSGRGTGNEVNATTDKSPVRSGSSHLLHQDSGIGDTCPMRKVSDISTVSSSGGSDEADSEKKLDLRSLIESIGTLLIPTTGFLYRAVYNLITGDPSIIQQIKTSCISASNFEECLNDVERKHLPIAADTILTLVTTIAKSNDKVREDVLRQLGEEYFKLCLSEYGSSIRMMGSNIVEFLSNLDGLQDYITASDKFKSHVPPSCRCEYELNKLTVHFYTDKRDLLEYYAGVLVGISKHLFYKQASVNVLCSDNMASIHHMFIVDADIDVGGCSAKRCNICSSHEIVSKNPSESKIGTQTFCKTFPFHVIFNKKFEIIQIGDALSRHVVSERKRDPKKGSLLMTSYFEIARPRIEPLTYSALLSHVNFTFVLRTKTMELKGQMIHLPEADGILFLGSPSVEKLDELIDKGIYISDLPIHDATRDVILVGEQTKAQDGLRRRMEDLKKSIVEASAAVEEEKRKNVELLQTIFPPKIAQSLWRNEKVEPQCIDDVTILFSDIVGFTAICASCSPMVVINMLSSLYTNFDSCCGELDVYKFLRTGSKGMSLVSFQNAVAAAFKAAVTVFWKDTESLDDVETIGDAYCVAGGLHRKSQHHAKQIAWMGLRMMEFASQQKSHDGKTIQMRIGIHSGTVLAGVVGVTMPRYCLFGNNVTLANRFESGSVATKINVSPTTQRLLSEGFQLTPRPRDCLPQGFPLNEEGTCYFLDGYVFPFSADSQNLSQSRQIEMAVQHYKIKDTDTNGK